MQAYLACRLLNIVFHAIVDINNAFLRQGCTLPGPQRHIALTMLSNATPGLSPLHLEFPRLNTKRYASSHRSTRGAVVPWTCPCYAYRDAARSLHDRTGNTDNRLKLRRTQIDELILASSQTFSSRYSDGVVDANSSLEGSLKGLIALSS